MLIDLGNKPAQNWFKMSYETMGAPSIRCEIVSEEAVISAARNAHSEVLLVYANEQMISTDENQDLPQPLAEFVRADNMAFRASMDTMHIIDTVESSRQLECFTIRVSNSMRTASLHYLMREDVTTETPDYDHGRVSVTSPYIECVVLSEVSYFLSPP